MESIKDQIKSLAKERNMNVVDLARSIEMTDQGLYKAFRTKSIKLIQLERIAETLECTIQELLPKQEQKLTSGNVSQGSEVYQNSIAKNNFFSGDKSEVIRLKTENEFLKSTVERLDKTVEKQDQDILFLREQMRNKL